MLNNQSFQLPCLYFLVLHVAPMNTDCNLTIKEITCYYSNIVEFHCLDLAILASYYLLTPVALVVFSYGHGAKGILSVDPGEK